MDYAGFLAKKAIRWRGTGVIADPHDFLFPWQRDIVRWALRKGRAAIWADCGLGKTPMQLSWAAALGVRTLILAPFCVAEQTEREAAKFGIRAVYQRRPAEAEKIVITNYERLHLFNPSDYEAIVLDESSILKAFDGKTRTRLIESFRDTRFRLCCTATPAPNDIAELANHAEFLGVMTRSEFLATWFVHDDAGWRLKRHGRDAFYRWLSSWAMSLTKPSDIGYSDEGYELPPLNIEELTIDAGDNWSLRPHGITERLRLRQASIEAKADALSILTNHGEQWIVWCGLNDEAKQASVRIDGAMNVHGAMDSDAKADAILRFCGGNPRVLVTKPRIAGFGLNLQHCSRMAFFGLGDSYEQYYQCIRRCWRFGQTKPVQAIIVVTDPERFVVSNVKRKEQEAKGTAAALIANCSLAEQEELHEG